MFRRGVLAGTPTLCTFVQVGSGRDGVGKLVRIEGALAEIEYFESPVGPRINRAEVAIDSVREVELSPQMRVFWFDQTVHAWRAGRVDGGLISAQALKASEDHYAVRFPNGLGGYIPISELHVRWSHPIQDPTEYLAERVTDTPFFFDGRSRIVRYIAAQRAAFGGLTGLASSAIDLLEHQVTTVRRVLADPIERYMLADEVGLGKTIEAGILIRQHILDQPHEARVLVVVPPHLVQQWRTELATKFFLGSSPRVQVIPEDALTDPDLEFGRITMLVVDEAQRPSLHAFDQDPNERRVYDVIRSIAAIAPRLLLLSGTPVLHQEEGFLAMLHLLDPDGYPLSDREQFRQRVRGRQTVAEATLDLADDASSFFASEALDKLEQLFSDDRRLEELCRRVREHLPLDLANVERVRALRALRTHLSETYRLHRRLLRTRRDDPRLKVHLRCRTGAICVKHEDPARREAFDFIETWRLNLLRAAENQLTPNNSQLFSLWIEAGLSHPRVLARYIRSRLALLQGSVPPAPTSSKLRAILGIPLAFDQETVLLRERHGLIMDSLGGDSRAQEFVSWLRSNRDVKKVIAFIDDQEVADLMTHALREALGLPNVVRYDGSIETVRTFEQQQSLAILVCDATAEEGLNLQRSGATLVHFDLPLEPARIEQRIGRVDRLEARGRMRNVVFTAECPFEGEWLECLSETIRVFDRSIAPLQYVLAEATSRIRSGLLLEGRASIKEEMVRMSDREIGLEAELRRIRAQEALDSVEGNADVDAVFFASLKEADEMAEAGGEKALNSWVIERLQFACHRLESDVLQYVHDLRRPTLVPLLETFHRFGACLDRAAKERDLKTLPLQPVTFERSTAETNHVGLLRVGHPIMNGLDAMVRSDDRGRAFAMWRYVPGSTRVPHVFFRFDLVIEADLTKVQSEFGSHVSLDALRRRADEEFPVEYRTVWLTGDLEQVLHDDVLELLERPYQQQARIDGSRDINIRLERWDRVDALVSISDWNELCRRARSAAEGVVLRDHEFTENCRRHATLARDLARSVSESLKSRIARLSGPVQVSETEMASLELRIGEALACGIESPSVRVDSAGAIFIAGQPMEEA